MKTHKCYFFQKVQNWRSWILSVSRVSVRRQKKSLWLCQYQSYIIDTSMERSSRVLQHGNQKIWFFFSKNFENEFDFYFDLCWNQHSSRSHLFFDIGDSTPSLWGSTSSFKTQCRFLTLLNLACSFSLSGCLLARLSGTGHFTLYQCYCKV